MDIIKMPPHPSIIPALFLFLDAYYYSQNYFGLTNDRRPNECHEVNTHVHSTVCMCKKSLRNGKFVRMQSCAAAMSIKISGQPPVERG